MVVATWPDGAERREAASSRTRLSHVQHPHRGLAATTRCRPSITAASRAVASIGGASHPCRPGQSDDAAGATDRAPMRCRQHLTGLTTRGRRYSFRHSTSVMAAFSSASSAYIRFQRRVLRLELLQTLQFRNARAREDLHRPADTSHRAQSPTVRDPLDGEAFRATTQTLRHFVVRPSFNQLYIVRCQLV